MRRHHLKIHKFFLALLLLSLCACTGTKEDPDVYLKQQLENAIATHAQEIPAEDNAYDRLLEQQIKDSTRMEASVGQEQQSLLTDGTASASEEKAVVVPIQKHMMETPSDESFIIGRNVIYPDAVSENTVSENTILTDMFSELKEPVNMILDMDYESDVDDVAALRVAIQFHKRGRVNLMGCMASVKGTDVCKAMHGQLLYEGLGTVPIGSCERGINGTDVFWSDFVERYFHATDYVCMNSVELYKALLKDCRYRGEKARIVVTGFMLNIEDLLSDPEGFELVRECVDSIWIDGGAYPQSGKDYNFFWTEETARAIRYANDICPVPMVFITNETAYHNGAVIYCGAATQYIINDPVNVAYCDYENIYNADLSGGHTAWDPITVWAAGMPLSETAMKLTLIDAYFEEDGTNTYIPVPMPEDISEYANPIRLILERTSNDMLWYSMRLDELIVVQ